MVDIDRSLNPPSFAIRFFDGRERETEAHRLSLHKSSLWPDVAIDRSIRPPSFAIRVDGRERETEAHRLSLHQSSLPSLSGRQGSVHGAVPAAVDADWGATSALNTVDVTLIRCSLHHRCIEQARNHVVARGWQRYAQGRTGCAAVRHTHRPRRRQQRLNAQG